MAQKTTVALLGNQIDADVQPVEFRVLVGPFRPEPRVRETILVDRICREERLNQPLEQAALLGLRVGEGSQVIQRPFESLAQPCTSRLAVVPITIQAYFVDAHSGGLALRPRYRVGSPPRGAALYPASRRPITGSAEARSSALTGVSRASPFRPWQMAEPMAE